MPAVANVFSQNPLLSRLVKMAGGISLDRQIPKFAPQIFKQWFRTRSIRQESKPKVILWPDTFNNHFYPDVCRAAVEVLEAAGFQVRVPERSLCCGRPLYDFGMLDTAKHLLRQILDTLRPEISAGLPVVFLEPSCAAVFRDELRNIFPNDQDAKRLAAQSYLLSEFLETMMDDYQIPPLKTKALVHGHCHHKAIMGMDNEKRLLYKLGLDYELLDSGCCGMAGSFGFEDGHYDISMKIGELVLLPAVRRVAKDTLIIADGFSCRDQIRQATDREALHTVQVLQMAIRQTVKGTSDPERISTALRKHTYATASRTMALLTVAATAGLLFLWMRSNSSS